MRCEVTPDDLFECQQCGQCCCGYGGTYLSGEDIENISEYLQISRDEFLEKYCSPSAGRYLLAQKHDGFCVFWDRLCTIHPIKPKMCMAWPFIENILRNPSAWDVMAQACPGMRTGFDPEDIIAIVKAKLAELQQVRNRNDLAAKNGEFL